MTDRIARRALPASYLADAPPKPRRLRPLFIAAAVLGAVVLWSVM